MSKFARDEEVRSFAFRVGEKLASSTRGDRDTPHPSIERPGDEDMTEPQRRLQTLHDLRQWLLLWRAREVPHATQSDTGRLFDAWSCRERTKRASPAADHATRIGEHVVRSPQRNVECSMH